MAGAAVVEAVLPDKVQLQPASLAPENRLELTPRNASKGLGGGGVARNKAESMATRVMVSVTLRW